MPKKKNKSIEEEILENRKTKKEEQENIEVDIVKPKLKHRVFSFNKTFDNLKIKYKKDPKKFIVLAASILVAFSLVIGSSYAYLTYISKTNSITTIEAGTLALNFKNETNSISLNNALPIKDEEGLEGKEEYEFTIENTGSLPASYVITLDNTCVAGKSYTIDGTSINADICIPINYIKVGLKEGSSDYKVLEYNESESQYIIDAGSLNSNGTKTYKMKLWLDYDTPNDYNSHGTLDVIFSAKLGLSYEQGVANLDTSGANEPILDTNMIAVYYDEISEVWKKADSTNMKKDYQWYDYDNKMWANSVTVTSSSRTTYQNAEPGTEIAMNDILTMQVWIPRYKYKVLNYNEDGTKTSEPQEIEIVFEEGTETTGEIECTDTISGTDGAKSESCTINNTECTDDTCNNKYYTHPAFTFREEEIEGFWIGKFELTGDIDNITTKPNLTSIRNQNVSSFSSNIMAMNDSNNQYGFNTSTDTHMIKNMEWGAVAYLSHSKYGVNREVYINNSSGYYTGRSGGNVGGSTPINGTYTDQTSTTQYNTYGYYTYDGYLLNYNTNTKSTTKDLSKVSSTTGNIYGVYDMSGGAAEYVMGNIVDSDGTTMRAGSSGFTTYPEEKYYDKYSFGTSSRQRIRSKLGDGIKEVLNTSRGWYSDYSYLAGSSGPWFVRSGGCSNGSVAGAFDSGNYSGSAHTNNSSRLVITP